MSARRLASLLALAALSAGAIAGCGDAGTTAEAPAPTTTSAPLTGDLRVFAYEDTVDKSLIGPFEQANPGLKVQTATFDSDNEAAAKLRAGFNADVVEVCLDEAKPLLQARLLRSLDPKGVPQLANLAPSVLKAKGVRDGGKLYVVPLDAGPEGLIYNTKALPGGISSFKDLFDPKLKGRVALEGDYALPPMAETALALGIKDPMNLTAAQVTQVKDYLVAHRSQFRTFWQSDSDVANLFKSGEIVAADGGQGLAQEIADAGVPVKWVPAKEGVISWVCGLAITSKAKNLAAAYRFIDDQASAAVQAERAKSGYVVTNPKALALVPAKYRTTADPAILDRAIAESEPPDFKQWTRAFTEVQSG
jgi:spermidine/putrescine transport system substrate-binding protein